MFKEKMKKLLQLLLLLVATCTTTFASESCKVKMNISFSSNLLPQKIEILNEIINSFMKKSNIELVETNSDYFILLNFRLSSDPHSIKLMPHFAIEGSVSGKHDRASEFGVSESLGFIKPRRASSGKVFVKPLIKALSQYLASCEELKKGSQENGDGTLEMRPGQSFTTHNGSTFEAVVHSSLGLSWKAPNGLIWGQALHGEFSNLDLDETEAINNTVQKTEASEACLGVGG